MTPLPSPPPSTPPNVPSSALSSIKVLPPAAGVEEKTTPLSTYTIETNNIIVEIKILQRELEAVPEYFLSISNISPTTKIILEKIRQEFVSKMNLEDLEKFESTNTVDRIKEEFKREIRMLITRYFPRTDEKTMSMLINYIIEENLGFGKIDILLRDKFLEEIVINSHTEPVWVYHRRFGWLKTNILIPTEARIRHYASMIGRDVGKEITNLSPLMDAHLLTGDRVNATLSPISTRGNTITIRKFAFDPWTITKFLEEGTISYDAAAMIWLAIQNELSILIAGGTGSGKTSMLNVISNFFPPNQRILSIEDTRELVLPHNLHWVPMETRLANPEGKGGVSMLDLLVNSLRMRPDRIIVGEIRREKEAEVLLEAMHTGHSVYATIHANTAEETITRLCNPPINIPKPMLAAVSLILVQNRNRRTGKRRVLQIAEVTQSGDARVLLQYNAQRDVLDKLHDSTTMYERLMLYTGMSAHELTFDVQQKVRILRWLVQKRVAGVDEIGVYMAKYYSGHLELT